MGFAAAMVKPVRASRLVNTVAEVLGAAPVTRRPSAEVRDPRASGVRPGLRILLAEDNAVNQMVAVRMLEKFGCQVEAVGDGLEAVNAWTRNRYDLIFMDVQMPNLDGYEATGRIREREAGSSRRTPIVAMTAHAMQGDDQRCLDAGMDDYVAKPIKREILEQVLVRWGGPPPQDTSVLDTERLGELCGMDGRLRREVLTDFLDLAPELLSQIEVALGRRDLVEASKASHLLGSSAQTLGGMALGAVCDELAARGADGSLDAARDTLARAREELARLQAALEPYVHDERARADGA